MLRLKTNLVINDSPDVNDTDFVFKRQTDFRVFDLKSLDAAVTSVTAGAFGRTSKARFWLVGAYLDDSDDSWIPIKIRLLIKNRQSGKWEVNSHAFKLAARTGDRPAQPVGGAHADLLQWELVPFRFFN